MFINHKELEGFDSTISWFSKKIVLFHILFQRIYRFINIKKYTNLLKEPPKSSVDKNESNITAKKHSYEEQYTKTKWTYYSMQVTSVDQLYTITSVIIFPQC